MLTKKEKEKLQTIGLAFGLIGVDDMFVLCECIYDEMICYFATGIKNITTPFSISDMEFVERMMAKVDKDYIL